MYISGRDVDFRVKFSRKIEAGGKKGKPKLGSALEETAVLCVGGRLHAPAAQRSRSSPWGQLAVHPRRGRESRQELRGQAAWPFISVFIVLRPS